MYKISEERMKSYSAQLENFSVYKIKKAMDLLSILQRNEENVYCHWNSLWLNVMTGNEKKAIETLTIDIFNKLKSTYFKRHKYQKKLIVQDLLNKKVKTLKEAITINQKVISVMASDGYEFYTGRLTQMGGWMWGLYATSD